MNPIIFLAGYTLLSVSLFVLYFSGFFHRLGFIDYIEHILQRRCPCIYSVTTFSKWVSYLLVACYHAVVMGCHITAIHDVLPTLENVNLHMPVNMAALMYHMWCIHTLFYLLCVLSDPGVINKHNHGGASTTYKYDSTMYIKHSVCRTCHFEKPARSKHCRACNRCVARFDHHCTWLHCCIGGNNYRYFIGILLTAILMCCNGSLLVKKFFDVIYVKRNLHIYKYIDSSGLRQPLGGVVLAQYPRPFLLMCSLSLLAALLSIFTLYHLYLISQNQTTNEADKLSKLVGDQRTRSAKFYNRGILKNIIETILPYKLSAAALHSTKSE